MLYAQCRKGWWVTNLAKRKKKKSKQVVSPWLASPRVCDCSVSGYGCFRSLPRGLLYISEQLEQGFRTDQAKCTAVIPALERWRLKDQEVGLGCVRLSEIYMCKGQ